MRLYEEIILLETVSKGENPRFKGKYVVENVIPYYQPLIQAQKRGRHLYWCNFILPQNIMERKNPELGNIKNELNALCKFHNYDFRKYKGKQRLDKIARNLVDYEAGKTILDTAMGIIHKQNVKQNRTILMNNKAYKAMSWALKNGIKIYIVATRKGLGIV